MIAMPWSGGVREWGNGVMEWGVEYSNTPILHHSQLGIMAASVQLLIFTVNAQRYALHLDAVERIVRAVAITPLPESSPGLLGVVNVQGRIVPVVNFRKRFRLPMRDVDLNDRLIIATAVDRTVALLVDDVVGVVAGRQEDVVPSARIGADPGYSAGMFKYGEEMVVIPNLANIIE